LSRGDFCRGQRAHFKVRRYVLFVDEFVLTVTGKVQNYRMGEESVRLLGLEAAAEVVSA
jgi:fatty-acyl-CoA synthase